MIYLKTRIGKESITTAAGKVSRYLLLANASTYTISLDLGYIEGKDIK